MKVNENSWHYKMVTYNDGPYTTLPMTVCGYFWAVVWAIVKRVGSILRIVSVVSLFAFAIGSVFNFIFVGVQDGQGAFQLVSLVTGAFIIIVMTIGAVLGFIIFLIAGIHILILHMIACRKYPKKKVDKKPNLVVEYLKAKKNKVCPLVEYTKGSDYEG